MGRKKTETNNYDITLLIDKEYNDFSVFYTSNKTLIYNQIVELFKIMLSKKKNKISLLIVGNIKNVKFNTVFEYSKKEKDVLKRSILPYFETIEDYEKCDEIKKMYDSL